MLDGCPMGGMVYVSYYYCILSLVEDMHLYMADASLQL